MVSSLYGGSIKVVVNDLRPSDLIYKNENKKPCITVKIVTKFLLSINIDLDLDLNTEFH